MTKLHNVSEPARTPPQRKSLSKVSTKTVQQVSQTSLLQFRHGQKPKPPLKQLPTYYFSLKQTGGARLWNITHGEIYVRSSLEWAYDATEQIEAFDVMPSLERRPCELGSYSGGGGHVINAKHLALELRTQILKMLNSGANAKNIRIFWSPRARELYEERVGRIIIPEITSEQIRKAFVEDVKREYSIWVAYDFDPAKKWSTQIIYPREGVWREPSLEVYIWHIKKTMKHRELVAFLNKSRTKGLQSHLNYLLRIQQSNLKDLDKPDVLNHYTQLEELSKDLEFARNGQVSKDDWGRCLWQGDPHNELDTEKEIIRYSEMLGLKRESPDILMRLFLLYQNMIQQIDPKKLPAKSSFKYKRLQKIGSDLEVQSKRSPQDIEKWKKILKENYSW